VSKNPLEWAERSRQYLGEVQAEFNKVTWPAQKEAVAGTVSVLAVVVVVSIGLFGVDSLLAWIVSWVLP
jgi:preprotein translocase subunit SecE